jgi:hypothetical protein
VGGPFVGFDEMSLAGCDDVSQGVYSKAVEAVTLCVRRAHGWWMAGDLLEWIDAEDSVSLLQWKAGGIHVAW